MLGDQAMGYSKVKAKIRNPTQRDKCVEVELVADTGAIYTMLPENLLKHLEISPTGRRKFRLARCYNS